MEVAHDAAEAQARLARFHPDVLVCDLEMPGEDGCSLIAKVRALGPIEGGSGGISDARAEAGRPAELVAMIASATGRTAAKQWAGR